MRDLTRFEDKKLKAVTNNDIGGGAHVSISIENGLSRWSCCRHAVTLQIMDRALVTVAMTRLEGGCNVSMVQVMDLECEGKAGVGLDELRWIHRHKTAALLKVAVISGGWGACVGFSLFFISTCHSFSIRYKAR